MRMLLRFSHVRASPLWAHAQLWTSQSLTTFASARSKQPHESDSSSHQAEGGSGLTTQAQVSPLLRHLQTKIMMRGGPLSLSEYMQDALTSPHGGFYMGRDVFGTTGDFTTSPEISQMFGEMIGAWVAHTWSEMGCPSRVALVELGPGRGTLMADALRSTAGFQAFRSAVEVHLVEVSPALRRMQWTALRCAPPPTQQPADQGIAAHATQPAGQGIAAGVCGINGAQVTWHHALDSVPRSLPAIFVAHEFFDALPVHQFVRDPKRGWLEKLVDVEDSSEGDPERSPHPVSQQPGQPPGGASANLMSAASAMSSASTSTASTDTADMSSVSSRAAVVATSVVSSGLRLVLSPSGTPAAALLVKRRLQGMSEEQAAKCEAIEVCGQGMAVAESLALRVSCQGGAALIVDYGQDAPYSDSLMAIRAHQGVGVLDDPGSADLSAWVDFSALRQAALGCNAPVAVSGPVTQAQFLLQLGIQQRLSTLLRAASPAQAETLVSGFNRITDERGGAGGMGASYKVMAITRRGQALPVGFNGGQVAIAGAFDPSASTLPDNVNPARQS